MMNSDNSPTNSHEEDFSELVKNYEKKGLSSRSPLIGKIVDIKNDGVVIDIGQKTEGILDKQEIMDWDGSLKYKVGDTITVIPRTVNFKEGYIIVSKKLLDMQEGWENVVRAYKRNIPILGKIVKITPDNKGFIVDMGIEMFLPMSQADITKVKAPKKLLGKEFWFRVAKLNRQDRDGTLSRRILLEEEKREKVKKLFGSLQVGDLIKGTVTSIVDFGAFVDIGGVEAFIHKDNISYGRISHPKEKLRKGDEIEAKILSIDQEKSKISLGIKQKLPDPWTHIEEKYPIGKRLVAKVVKTVDFGAFIELEEGVEGLLHISDLTWEGRPSSVEEYVAIGDKLWVQIIEVSKEAKKIRLGLKQLEMRPEEKYLQKHAVGEIVKGHVKKILKSRVFVGLEEGIEGVIRISDISYFRVESPEEFLKEKEEIEVAIISDELDRNYKVQLGLKQLAGKEWHEFFKNHRPGDIIPVTVKKVMEKGMTVSISKNIEGFIRLSELQEEKITFEEAAVKFKPDEKREALILNTEPDKKKIYLSLRAVSKVREREDIEKYMKSGDDAVTTIGDLLQNEIQRKK